MELPGHPAHTAGDLAVWLPDVRVLFVGDLLFHQVTPLVFMGSVGGARRALDWIAAFEPDHVVPGHGPLIDAVDLPGVLDTHRRYYDIRYDDIRYDDIRYYDIVLDTARLGRLAGRSPLDAARGCVLGTLADQPDAEQIVLNLGGTAASPHTTAQACSGPL